MRNLARIVTLAAVCVGLFPSVTSADCMSGGAVISTNNFPDVTYIWTSDVFAANPSNYGYNYTYDIVPPVSGSFGISFWVLGSGNPAPLAGIDNGVLDPTNGFYYITYDYNYTTYYQSGRLLTSWQGGTDGCPSGGDCLAVLFDDQNGARGSFAFVTAVTAATLTTILTQPNDDPIVLEPIPALQLDSAQPDAIGMNVDVTVPTPASGTYPLDNCPADVLANVYYRTTISGTAAPNERDRTLWTRGTSTPLDLGTTQTVFVPCTPGEDIYLAAALAFDSGYETAFVSENVGPISCSTSDGDGDGFGVANDCNDDDAAINPDAYEIPGNEPDENCDGVSACNPADFCSFHRYVSCVRRACAVLIDAGVLDLRGCNDLIIFNGGFDRSGMLERFTPARTPRDDGQRSSGRQRSTTPSKRND